MSQNSRTVRVGLVGEGIGASRSPALHMQEGAEQGLDYSYVLFDLAGEAGDATALARTLDAAEAHGFAGLNVTHPFKQAVIQHLHELSPDAEAVGAVNTVVFHEGRRIGHNTDGSGFAESFRRGLTGAPLGEVVQLGAGGAGVAVAQALMMLGTRRLVIHDREEAKARQAAAALCARFGEGRAVFGQGLEGTLAAADGLVNATPVGMASYPGLPLPAALLRPDLWVAEIVYFPLETALLAHARSLGCRTMDGGGMAVFQAVGALRLFTGREPDAERMLAHFKAMAVSQEQAARAPDAA